MADERRGALQDGASGSRLYVDQHGPADAPILLLTHGWGMDNTFWDAARQDLGGRFRLVTWDLPGLGKSKAPRGGVVSLAGFAKDLGGLLETLDRPAVLIGHSIGGMTIQTLIRDHPTSQERIAGIVLLNTTYRNPLTTMVGAPLLCLLQKPLLTPLMWLTVMLSPLSWLSKWQSYLSGSTHLAMRFGFGKTATRRDLEHVSLLATKARPAIEARGNLAMFSWDATGAMAALDRPLLIIGGDMDVITKIEASSAIARQAGGAKLEVIEGANHMGPLERADRYHALIAQFALNATNGATKPVIVDECLDDQLLDTGQEEVFARSEVEGSVTEHQSSAGSSSGLNVPHIGRLDGNTSKSSD
ncbi:MAG: alpha/beta hydrolase [Hyphomonadaceae bacterium]|nr:alpha/beta hydrolase [Hyphomonadaceae bacterium]